MAPLVQNQVEISGASFPTLTTFKGLLSSVGAQVLPQVEGIFEGLLAFLALKELFCHVHPLMSQVRAIAKGLFTLVAT